MSTRYSSWSTRFVVTCGLTLALGAVPTVALAAQQGDVPTPENGIEAPVDPADAKKPGDEELPGGAYDQQDDNTMLTSQSYDYADPNPAQLSSVTVAPEEATVGTNVAVSYDLKDADGVDSVMADVAEADAYSRGGNVLSKSSSFPLGVEYDPATRTYVVVDDTWDPGDYRVWSLEVLDKAGYHTTFCAPDLPEQYRGEGWVVSQSLAGKGFRVAEHAADPNPAQLSSVTVAPEEATVGTNVAVSYDLKDADGVDSVMADVAEADAYSRGGNVLSKSSSFPLGVEYDPATRTYVVVDDTWDPGDYRVWSLEVLDKAGYHTTFCAPDLPEQYRGEGWVVSQALAGKGFEVVPPVYHAIKGDGSTYTQGADEGLTITFDGPREKLSSVYLDERELAAKDYDVRSGSTVVTLHADLLAGLGTGTHTLQAYYTDHGAARATFSIVEKQAAKPGDDNAGTVPGATATKPPVTAAPAAVRTPAPELRAKGGNSLPQTGDPIGAAPSVLAALGALAFFEARHLRRES